MINNDNKILFTIKRKHNSNVGKNKDFEVNNKENNISYNSISNYLVKNNKIEIAKMLEKDENIDNSKNTENINLQKEINKDNLKNKEMNEQNIAYSNLSKELFNFNRKINKVLLDLHNIQEDLHKKKMNETPSFEIKQNNAGDDEFYINNKVVSESYFMSQLMQYKKK